MHRPERTIRQLSRGVSQTVCLALLLALSSANSFSQGNTLVITGSDTLGGLLAAWSSEFGQRFPKTAVEIQAAGSAAAPIALAEGTASIGAMSRPMSSEELERFLRRKGYLPTAIAVARDALAIVVHPTNPLSALSGKELDAIFSATAQCGGRVIRQWRDIDPQADALGPIEPYGRTSISGSYGFFKREALCGGDYSSRVIELPGFAALVDSVANTPQAIAYVSLGFVNERVKMLPLRLAPNRSVAPDQQPDLGQSPYPLARTLYLYLSVPPGEKASQQECDFLQFIAEPAAQALLRSEGFLPIGDESGIGDDYLTAELNVCTG